MATAMDSLPVFEGRVDEDIRRWLDEVDIVTKVANFSEKCIKLIILKLRGKSRVDDNEKQN